MTAEEKGKDSMMKKKPLIAVLINRDENIYCLRLELLQALVQEGYELLISCQDGPKLRLLGDIPYIFDPVDYERRGTNPFRDAKLFCHYQKLLRKFRPRAVLTFTAKPNVYGAFAAKSLGIPYISNVTGLGSVAGLSGVKQRIILGFFRLAYRNAACVMFQNRSNLAFAGEQGMLKGDYRLIPGSGVALNRFPLQDYPAGGDGKSGDKFVVNYFGRVLREKGIDCFIEVAKRIKSKYPETEFNVIGFVEPSENHYLAELRELEREGVLFYRGDQEDVRPWIARGHVIFHPSAYGEGLSNVLLENAASGRPLITTDNPGCRELVLEGKNGFLCPIGDSDAMTAALEALLAMNNGDRKTMGLQSRAHVEENFSREIVIQAYLEEIRKLI